jgi:hypothetical protein
MSRIVMGADDLLEEVMQIYYNASTNQFMDEGGYEIFNIYRVLSPNVIFLFKYKKDDMFAYGVNGEYIELIYEDYNYIYGDSDLPVDRYY